MSGGDRRGIVGAAGPQVAPYGSWGSPIEVELVAGTAVGLSEPWLDGDDAYWLETRSSEGGRRTLLRHGLDGRTVELTPFPFRVGNRVHEYGGGSYAVNGGRVVASSQADGRLYRLDPDALADPVAITPEGPWTPPARARTPGGLHLPAAILHRASPPASAPRLPRSLL